MTNFTVSAAIWHATADKGIRSKSLAITCDVKGGLERQILGKRGTVYETLTRTGTWVTIRTKRGRRDGEDGDRPRY